jgi:lipopolysaccharide transport system permease protein
MRKVPSGETKPDNVTNSVGGPVTSTTIIRPSKGFFSIRWKELWEYRELLYFLIWRDIKVRYKQTVIGFAWAIIQPFLTMVVFSVFFGKFAKIPSEGFPYPLFAYCALVPWTYFGHSINNATNSIVENQRLIVKVYFPRLILPVSAVFSQLPDFIISFSILIMMMFFYGVMPTANLLWLPFLILFMSLTALAVGIWLTTFNAIYRDVRYAVPFLIQFWLFASPVAYPSSLIPEKWRAFYGLNPMAGVIEGFRWALLGKGEPPQALLFFSLGVILCVLFTGIIYFRRMEGTITDVI